jgi:hypothetical protein
VLGLVIALVAVAGAAMLALAAHEGSFTRGGEVVDQKLAQAAGQAQAVSQNAVAQTGAVIQNAGATLQRKASGANGQTP